MFIKIGERVKHDELVMGNWWSNNLGVSFKNIFENLENNVHFSYISIIGSCVLSVAAGIASVIKSLGAGRVEVGTFA